MCAENEEWAAEGGRQKKLQVKISCLTGFDGFTSWLEERGGFGRLLTNQNCIPFEIFKYHIELLWDQLKRQVGYTVGGERIREEGEEDEVTGAKMKKR